MLEFLFPADVATAHADANTQIERLFESEEAAVARAVEKRRRDFALGRSCARLALARLGVEPVAIPVAQNRAPIWPPAVVGSITHCEGFAAAAVGWKREYAGLGMDAEPAGPPLEPRLTRLICTPKESEGLPSRAAPAGTDWPRLVFSAKEAVYKAVAPMSGVFLGFRDVELDFDLDAGEFGARVVGKGDERLPDFGRLRGRFAVLDGLVLCSAVVPSSAAEATDVPASGPDARMQL